MVECHIYIYRARSNTLPFRLLDMSRWLREGTLTKSYKISLSLSYNIYIYFIMNYTQFFSTTAGRCSAFGACGPSSQDWTPHPALKIENHPTGVVLLKC